MSTTQDETRLNECACGCGQLVKGTWARGHWARGARQNQDELGPLPGPDDDLDPGDGTLPPELVAELDELAELGWIDQPPPGGGSGPEEEPGPDPPAGKIPPPRSTPGPRGKRATAAVQRDVTAKIRMVLVPAGRLWAVRDQVCGPVFCEQEPEISSALAEIVCDSPDLLNWFTGPAGGYMKYFRLIMAVQPVALVLWLHHVAHARQVMPDSPQQPQQQPGYAA